MNPYENADFSYLIDGKGELTGSTLVSVTNMGRKSVYYELPEINIVRDWAPYQTGMVPQTKTVPFSELYALNNAAGGRQIIWDNLLIKDSKIREALDLPLAEDSPEVLYPRERVREILINGTEDEVLDMLEFGPYYIAEWTKEEIVNIDSTTRRNFIGGIFQTDIANLEANLKWAADDAAADQLGYGTIQGIDKSKMPKTSQRRTSAKKTADSGDKQTPGTRKRRTPAKKD